MKRKCIFFGSLIVILLFIGTAGATLCGDLSTYTYKVPINENVKVYFSESEIFIPTASGEFKVYLDHYDNWGFSYSDDISNVLPAFMLDSGIKPVSIEFGMDIDVVWDSGFSSSANLNLDPSFKFISYSTNVRVNSQYPGGYEMKPYSVNYIQDGRDYGSNYERNLRNAPYTFRFKYSTETPVDSYQGGFGAWIANFQYGNVGGDDVSSDGYGLIFTIQNFYFTFTYRDESVQQGIDDINSALNDDSFSDNGVSSDFEDMKDQFDVSVPENIPVDDTLNFLTKASSLLGTEMKSFFSAFYQPIMVTVFGFTFDLLDVFFGFLIFFLVAGLIFLILKGSHNSGSKGD